jgi:hypothetical protein
VVPVEGIEGEDAGSYGAYGLRLTGIDGCAPLLVPAEATWPVVRVIVERAAGDEAPPEQVGTDSAVVRLRTGGWLEIDRRPGVARYRVPTPLSPEEIVHPFLAPVAAVTSHWYGHEPLHAGAVVLSALAWGIVGGRMGGKSSLLAALALRGVDVIADDVLVVHGSNAIVGPRTIDLREDAAAALGVGESIGRAGARSRWRLRLTAAPASTPLGGWIFLGWADATSIRRLSAAEALQRLARNRAIRLPPARPERFLELAALPAWELCRPRQWSGVSQVVDELLSVVSARR